MVEFKQIRWTFGSVGFGLIFFISLIGLIVLIDTKKVCGGKKVKNVWITTSILSGILFTLALGQQVCDKNCEDRDQSRNDIQRDIMFSVVSVILLGILLYIPLSVKISTCEIHKNLVIVNTSLCSILIVLNITYAVWLFRKYSNSKN